MKDFLIDYVEKNKKKWKVKPELIHGEDFQDCLILKFGKPRTAIFAHMDSIGFTVRYGKELVKLGGPRIFSGTKLIGEDSKGKIEKIFLKMNVHYVVYVPHVKEQRERCPLPHKHILKLTPCLTALISNPPSPVHVSKR